MEHYFWETCNKSILTCKRASMQVQPKVVYT